MKKLMCVLLSVLPLAPQITPMPLPLFAPKAQIVRVFYVDLNEVVETPIEQYIAGVVAAEVPITFEKDALKAQAVAARTYTLYKAAHGGCAMHKGADICTDSTHCQAFRRVSELDSRYDIVREAVFATRDLVMTYGGQLINALFHASSGAKTADVVEVFGGNAPYLRSVDSPENEALVEVTFTREQLLAKMKAMSAKIILTDAPLDRQISIVKRAASGRVSELKIGNITLSGTDARRALGLRSTDFELTFVGDSVTFLTTGYGHGVGLSQVGANAMAQNGATYEDVLRHYYTGCEVNVLVK